MYLVSRPILGRYLTGSSAYTLHSIAHPEISSWNTVEYCGVKLNREVGSRGHKVGYWTVVTVFSRLLDDLDV